MQSRVAKLLALVLLGALLLSACAPAATPEPTDVETPAAGETPTTQPEAPAEGETPTSEPEESEPAAARPLIIGYAQEPDSLSTIFAQMTASAEAISFIHRNLFVIDDSGEFVPVLLEETPSLENGGIELLPDDKMQVTYRFRQGIHWADGVEITAHDFVFTHDLIMDPNIPVATRLIHEDMETVEAIDDYTLVVTYSTLIPYGEYVQQRDYILPKHYVEPILEQYKEEGGDYGVKLSQDERIARMPLGNGPYVVDEWIPGDHLTLVANEAFDLNENQPQIDTIVIRFIPDLNTLATNVQTGDVDVTTQIGLGLEQALQIQEQNLPNTNVHFIPMWNVEIFQMYLSVPPLDDVRVRQALLYAIDRQELVDALFAGAYTVADSYFPPNHPAYNPDVPKYPYDPDTARALLEEAGYTPGPGGTLVNEDGEPLKIVYQTTAGNRERERTQQVVARYWEEIGIEVEIQNETASTFFGDTFLKMQTPGQVLEWAIQNAPTFLGHVIGVCEPIATEENNWANAGKNLYHFCDEEYKAVADELLTTIDSAERLELQKEIQVLHQEKLPFTPLFFKPKILTSITGLENFKPEGFFVGWNVEEWELTQ